MNGTPTGVGSAESKGRKGGMCDASARRSLAVRGYIEIYRGHLSRIPVVDSIDSPDQSYIRCLTARDGAKDSAE